MSDDLREEIARALAASDDKWKGWPWVAISERVQKMFLADADAILPIIARVREEARAEVVKWIESDASQCDCAAHSSSECACGAWDDYKRVTSMDLVRQLREAFNAPHKP